MSPAGGLALLMVVLAATGMIVFALVRGHAKRNYAPTDEKDLVRRVHVKMTASKARDLCALLTKAAETVEAKKKGDDTPVKTDTYVENENGSCLLEVTVTKS